MRAYVREIFGKPSTSKPISEDSHYTHYFSDKEGTQWGLFMVADGLKGHRGSIASNMALYCLSSYLGEKMGNTGKENHEELIQEAIIQASEQLESYEKETSERKPCTTLDLLLTSEEDLYTAHLGDSRIYLVGNSSCPVEKITEDEGGGSGPLNYIGTNLIEGQGAPIKYRAEKAVKHRKITPGDYHYAFLATDGLMVRATDEQIGQALRCLGKYNNPQAVLDNLAEIIACPREKLLEQTMSQLDRLLKGVEGIETKKKTRTEIAEAIIENYIKKKDKTLAENIDRGLGNGSLKADDAIMMIVDFRDQVGRGLGALNTLEEKTIPDLTKERDGYQGKYNAAEEEKRNLSREIGCLNTTIGELTTEKGNLQDKLRERNEEYKEVLGEKETLEEEKGDLETRLIAKETERSDFEEIADHLYGKYLQIEKYVKNIFKGEEKVEK